MHYGQLIKHRMCGGGGGGGGVGGGGGGGDNFLPTVYVLNVFVEHHLYLFVFTTET